MRRILVTGGAGYVGSHTVVQLIANEYAVEVVDNLSTGNRWAVPDTVQLHEIDLLDQDALNAIFTSQHYDAVIHLAARSLVGESMQHPLDYLSDNIITALNVLKCMHRHHVNQIVFSSTANVYGSNAKCPIDETAELAPGSPYGESKLAIEKLLQWTDRLYGIRYAVLRYFNAAGADPSGAIGESHDPETHLIPLVLQTALGKRDEFVVLGDDYNTQDGIRPDSPISEFQEFIAKLSRLLVDQNR